MLRATRHAARDVRRVVRGDSATHLHLRERVTAIFAITLAVDLVASVTILFLERDAERTEITNFGDSIFWVSCQLLTVSSQMPNPISTGGRVVDVLLEAYAITVVAALAGSFAAFFHRRGKERDAAEGAGG